MKLFLVQRVNPDFEEPSLCVIRAETSEEATQIARDADYYFGEETADQITTTELCTDGEQGLIAWR